MVAVPSSQPRAKRQTVSSQELEQESMLLLGADHCFGDQVLEECPEFARFSSNADGIRKTFEGSSLETIKHMVASGMGVTVVPQLSVPSEALIPAKGRRRAVVEIHVRYLPVLDEDARPPMRRVLRAWRRSFTRYEAIGALRNAL